MGDDKRVKITYYLTLPILKQLLKKNSQLKEIVVKPSTKVSKKVKLSLRERGIRLRIDKRRGGPSKYKHKTIVEIRRLKRGGASNRAIEKKTGIPHTSVQYLVTGRKNLD